MKDNHLSKMKLLLSFLLLTTLTWQALAQSCPSNAAPNDQVARCVTDDPQYRHTYPDDWRVLMDSINYLELIDDRDGVWQRLDMDGTGTTWQQAGSICGHEVSVCETGTNRNNWFFTQYICYLDASEVIVNVTHDFTGCCCGCQSRVTLHRYERDDTNAAAARDPNNYSQLQVVTDRSGFGLILGNTDFRFLPSNNSRGFYIGAQDTGSCVSIRRLTLYYRICPGRVEGVTVIPEIALPPQGSTDRSTGVATCRPNAVPAPGTSLEIECDANGVRTGDPECVCSRGYEFVAATANSPAECRVCPPGTYQARDSNDFSCQPCPANSVARDPATAVCECDCGFSRPPDDPDAPCTPITTQEPGEPCPPCPTTCPPVPPPGTPGRPSNVQVLDGVVVWDRPSNTGNAEIIRYELRFYRRVSGSLSNIITQTVNNPDQQRYRPVQLPPGGPVYVQVRATNSASRTGPWSTEVEYDVNECITSNGGCAQLCTNTQGSFQCSCRSGYRLNSNGRTCTDVNECNTSNGGCAQLCTNTQGSFQCSCRSGYRLSSNRRSCVAIEINECTEGTHNCDQICTHTAGSFRCSCRNGYRLNSNGRTCNDINECSNSNGGCAHTCTNTQGSFRCSCRSGYRLNGDGRGCTEINECTEGTHNCDQICTNTPQGSFRCSCRSGYRLNSDGRTCDDVNECSTNNGGCAHACINTQGSFRCSCRSGYRLNNNGRSCSEINECTEGTHNCDQICTNTQGSFLCSCRSGYRLNSNGRTCTDVNECNTNNGGCAQLCTNTQGSFQCSCRSDFRLNGNGRTCDAVTTPTPISRPGLVRNLRVINGVVVWNEPSSTGGEISGYDLRFYSSGGQSIAPIRSLNSAREWYNPAASIIPSGRPVYVQVRAKNSAGTGTWINQVAYDVNECNTNNGGCAQICTNTQGSFQCSCRSGYRLLSNGRTCADINECTEGTHNCNQECTNTQGSFRCSCRSGYRLNGDGRTCDDINECTEGTHNCDQICANTQGSFRCSCRSGYRLNGDGRTCDEPVSLTSPTPIPTTPTPSSASLMFQMRLGPVTNCARWGNRKAERLEQAIQLALIDGIRGLCACNFTQEAIDAGEFSCQTTITEVIYRSTLQGIETHSAEDLKGFAEAWINGGGTVSFGRTRLRVCKDCPFEVSSFDDPECDPVCLATDRFADICIGHCLRRTGVENSCYTV